MCADLARTQSAATARHSLGVLPRVFDYAVQDGAIPRNPVTGIRLPKAQGNEPQPLTHIELWQLAEQFDSRRDRVLIVVAGYCGLRWGELAVLRWTDIDLDLCRLRVSRAYSEEAPRGEMSPVKDHQARTVPIPRTVVDELTELQALSAPSELVSPPGTPRRYATAIFDATASMQLRLLCACRSLRTTSVTPQRRWPYKRGLRLLRWRAYLAMSRPRRRSITMQGSSRPISTTSRYASMPPPERPSGTSERYFVSLAHRRGTDQQTARLMAEARKPSLNS